MEANYLYTAIDDHGKRVQGILSAENALEALERHRPPSLPQGDNDD